MCLSFVVFVFSLLRWKIFANVGPTIENVPTKKISPTKSKSTPTRVQKHLFTFTNAILLLLLLLRLPLLFSIVVCLECLFRCVSVCVKCCAIAILLLRFFFQSLNLHCFLLFVAWHTGLVYRHDDRVGAHFNSTLHIYTMCRLSWNSLWICLINTDHWLCFSFCVCLCLCVCAMAMCVQVIVSI